MMRVAAPASVPPVHRSRDPTQAQATNAARVEVKAVRSRILPGGLECYIGDDGERYLSQRGIVQSVRTSKTAPGTRGAEDGKIDRLTAKLINSSDDLTRGAEFAMLIPRRRAVSCARMAAPRASSSRSARPTPPRSPPAPSVRIRCRWRIGASACSAFAQKGIEAMVNEACGNGRGHFGKCQQV
jgi:hypothetical protein